jgi:hypothetical protein
MYVNNDTVAEWLRRQIRNLLEFLRAGSSPVGVVRSFLVDTYLLLPLCESPTTLQFFLNQLSSQNYFLFLLKTVR